MKKISQFGIPDKYYHFENFSRYEHSVGVMILLHKLGATTEEQVAGLLHDVSTLSFSHISDWVFGEGGKGGAEDYHDSIHEEFVKKTEIPVILKKYGFSEDRLIDSHNFTLLENDVPDLCADRIDYTLREFKYWLNPEIVDKCIKDLVDYNGEIVFNSKETAYDFAMNYLKAQTDHWGGYESIMRYYLFSNVLKKMISNDLIKEQDFYKDEEHILSKFKDVEDIEIQSTLKLLENKKLPNMRNKTGKKLIKKFRFVDPKVLIDGKIRRLSHINAQFSKMVEEKRMLNKEGLLV